MTRDDLPRLLEIERESFPVPWTRGMFLDQLSQGAFSINVVCVSGGLVTGYAAAWAICDEIHLLSIAVDPRNRRAGAGTALLEAVIEEGRPAGGRIVMLEVRRGNDPARRFYEKHGFRTVGERPGYYRETGEDAVLMERILDD